MALLDCELLWYGLSSYSVLISNVKCSWQTKIFSYLYEPSGYLFCDIGITFSQGYLLSLTVAQVTVAIIFTVSIIGTSAATELDALSPYCMYRCGPFVRLSLTQSPFLVISSLVIPASELLISVLGESWYLARKQNSSVGFLFMRIL